MFRDKLIGHPLPPRKHVALLRPCEPVVTEGKGVGDVGREICNCGASRSVYHREDRKDPVYGPWMDRNSRTPGSDRPTAAGGRPR